MAPSAAPAMVRLSPVYSTKMRMRDKVKDDRVRWVGLKVGPMYIFFLYNQ